MKLIGLVFLGLIATGIAYFLLLMSLTKVLGDIRGSGIPISIFAVIPIALLLGSFPIGFFSYNDIENKCQIFLMVPAIYLELAVFCDLGLQFLLDLLIGASKPGMYGILGDILMPAGIGLYWYLASTIGAFLGYFLKDRLAKWLYRK
jgi:hypothetical protein